MFSVEDILLQWPLFLILFLRSSGLLLAAPVFNSRNIPNVLKIFFILVVSTTVFMAFPSENFSYTWDTLSMLVIFVSEFMVGLIIGYLAQLIFQTIQLAGQSIDMQMGFGIVNVMDPQSGLQIPLIGNFKHLLAILIFLIINGHHWLLEGLIASYRLVPIQSISFNYQFAEGLINITAKMFVIAFQIAAPLVGVLFITDFVMGIISRTVPQMNVFLVGLPAKILIGFLVLLLVIPLYIFFLTALFERSYQDLWWILKVLT